MERIPLREFHAAHSAGRGFPRRNRLGMIISRAGGPANAAASKFFIRQPTWVRDAMCCREDVTFG